MRSRRRPRRPPRATRSGWSEPGTGLVELDEILGYHLEQACRYRAELGLPADGARLQAARRRLLAAGHRAALRQDYGAAVSLLERAAALVPAAEVDLALEAQLGDALLWAGRVDEALRRADALADRASAAGDRVGELSLRFRRRASCASSSSRTGAAEALAALVERAARVRGGRRRPGAPYRVLGARGGGEHAGGTTRRSRRTSEPSPRAAGGLPDAWLLGGSGRLPLLRHDAVSEMLAWLDEHEPRDGRD